MQLPKHSGRFACVLIVGAMFLASAAPARAEEARPIGMVKSVSGSVYVERGGQREQVAAGYRLMRGDWLETSRSGAVGVAFRDSTMISIGPETRVLLNEYAFEPAEGRFEFVLDLARGTLVYISGIIAKLMPEAVEIKTPASTVAVRGTRFLAKVDPAD